MCWPVPCCHVDRMPIPISFPSRRARLFPRRAARATALPVPVIRQSSACCVSVVRTAPRQVCAVQYVSALGISVLNPPYAVALCAYRVVITMYTVFTQHTAQSYDVDYIPFSSCTTILGFLRLVSQCRCVVLKNRFF